MKDVVAQGGGITVDTGENEIVIGPDIRRIKVTANIMAESLSTYLFIIIRHTKQGQSSPKDVAHALAQHNFGYAGVVAVGVINDVTEGDRISVVHDCTGQIRGQYSQVIVEQV